MGASQARRDGSPGNASEFLVPGSPLQMRKRAGAGTTSVNDPAKTREGSVKMRVSEAMTRDVYISSPDETIQSAALAMAGIDAGVVPVADKDRLVGMITDRDIAIRGVAEGKSPNTKVRDVMTTDVKY